MYDPVNGHRAPEKSKNRKTESDPGHSYVAQRPYIRRPAPARQAGEPTADLPHRSRSRSPSGEHVGSPFVPRVQAYYHYPTSNAPIQKETPPTPVFPRSPSPPPQRSTSRRDGNNSKAPQGSAPQIRDGGPPPPRSALNAPSAAPAPHPTGGQPEGRGWLGALTRSKSPPPTLSQRALMQRQESHRAVYRSPPPSPRQSDESTSATYADSSRHRSNTHYHHHRPRHHASTTHRDHGSHRRSRSRPPSAPSRRYASGYTHPVYGHGGSATSSTSLNDGVPLHRHHDQHATSRPRGTAASYYRYPGLSRTRSASPQRPGAPVRPPSPSIPPSIAIPHPTHKLEKPKPPPSPPPTANENQHHHLAHRPRLLAASELCRNPHRPALPPGFDGQMETRYVNMLLAMDGISPVYYVLSSFFTWILLAGFMVLPGTFVSLNDRPGAAGSVILNLINNFGLYVIAFVCTGIGATGMIWLWWRWHGNYVWVSNRIFIPGFLNSVAGVISSLTNIYGIQGGVFGKTEKSAIFVTGSLSVVCGILVMVYELWLIRNLKLEHDHEVGAELAGEWGEGVLGEKKEGGGEEV